MTLTYNRFKTLDEFFDTLWTGFLPGTPSEKVGVGYPPYDIIKETIDGVTTYSLQMALAGFKKDEIEVIQTKDTLTIRPTSKTYKEIEYSNQTDTRKYIRKGIAKRIFERTFAMDPSLEVDAVTFVDGILSIKMKVNVQEADKTKYLPIL